MGGDEVARRVNEVFRPVGIGAFHGAVEVYGREWSFGQTEEGSGIFSCEPRLCPEHTYRESIPMGETVLSRREVRDLLRRIEWPGFEYDLLRRNCCHWCDEFCKRLGVGPIPAWVNQLAGEVASVDDGFRKFDAEFKQVVNNAKAVMEDARSKTVQFNYQIHHNFETKTNEIKEHVQAKAHEVREAFESVGDVFEAKADEVKSNLDEFKAKAVQKAEEIDRKLKSQVASVADDWDRAFDGFRHRDGRGQSLVNQQAENGLSSAWTRNLNILNAWGGSEEPPAVNMSPSRPAPSRQKSA